MDFFFHPSGKRIEEVVEREDEISSDSKRPKKKKGEGKNISLKNIL